MGIVFLKLTEVRHNINFVLSLAGTVISDYIFNWYFKVSYLFAAVSLSNL